MSANDPLTDIPRAIATSEVTTDACSKQIVNWDIAKERLHETTSAVATGWEHLRVALKALNRQVKYLNSSCEV